MPKFQVGGGPSTTPPPPQTGGTVLRPPGQNMRLTLWSLDLTFTKRVLRGTFMRADVWALESPYYATAGETLPLSGVFEFASTITSPSVKCYKDGVDTSSTNISGAASAAGNVVTMGSLTALQGGERYVVECTATVDGATQIKAMEFIVRAAGDEQ